MADCYYHGYTGSPGPCQKCKEEEEHGEEPGTRGLALDSDLVQDLANQNSIGLENLIKQNARSKHRRGFRKAARGL